MHKECKNMENSIYHETYGTITYTEGLWSGKKNIWMNGTKLVKIDKKRYRYIKGLESFVVEIQGSAISGVALNIQGEKIQVVPKPAWYVFIFSILMFALIFLGGAIGGLVGSAFAISYITVSQKMKNVWFKILAGVLFTAIAWAIYYVLALFFFLMINP